MRQLMGAPQTKTEEKKGKHEDLLVRLNGLREERGARSSAQSVEDGAKATVTVGRHGNSLAKMFSMRPNSLKKLDLSSADCHLPL